VTTCLAIGTGTRIACLLLSIYWLILLVRILASWFPAPRSGLLHALLRFVYDVTDPVLRPLRNLIPAVRMGAMAMDFSPIILFIVIAVVQRAIGCAGFGL
jgi:YggT family protein